MKKILFNLFFVFIFALSVSNFVMAADLTITCNSVSCTPKANPALFSSTEIWYPERSLSKTVNFSNTTDDPITINISGENSSAMGNLDTVINLTITRKATGINVFNNTINKFYGKIISLPALINNSEEDYVFTATINSESGNEFQNKNTKFDLLFNFNVGSPPSIISSSDNQSTQSIPDVLGISSSEEELITPTPEAVKEINEIKIINKTSVWKKILPTIISLLIGSLGWIFRKKIFKNE